jgi:hypothetical protein
VVTVGTNGQITGCDWETTPQMSFAITFAGTNWVNWCTNLDPYGIGFAQWIGVYALSNSQVAGSYITNFSVGLNKKIIPIRYP